MKILTVDVDTGTQDIFLYDSHLDLENGFKLVVPSPTMIVHRRLKQATRQRRSVALTGVTMGGGPSSWAAEEHIRAGLALYATPEAARSFHDDLEAVQAIDRLSFSLPWPASAFRYELLENTQSFLHVAEIVEAEGARQVVGAAVV